MDRRVSGCLPMMLMLLPAAEAAEPGFYVGATAGRVEQELDESAGVGPFAVAVPSLGFFPTPTPGPRPPPIISPGPIGGVFTPLTADRVDSDDVDAGWGITLGYRINRYLAAEVAYTDFGQASLTEWYRFASTTPGSIPLEIVRAYDVEVRGPSLSILGVLPVGERWQVFLRAAMLFADQEFESTFDSSQQLLPSVFHRTFSDEVVMAGVGVQWSFTPRWTARLEYQRTDDLQPNAIGGESRIDQASVSVLFSL